MIDTKWLFRLLSLMAVISVFLPIVFKNIIYPFSSHLFWYFLWTIALGALKPRLFVSKGMKYLYLYIFIYFALFFTLWIDFDRSTKIRFSNELYELIVSITLIHYYMSEKDFEGLKWVIRAVLMIIGITSFISLFWLFVYPTAARDMAGELAQNGEINLLFYYERLGIANYGFYSSLIFITIGLLGVRNIIFNKFSKALISLLVILFLLTHFS